MPSRALVSIALGTLIFLLNHTAPISGALATPAGYEPSYFVTSADVPQYLSFLAAARESWLLPNIHMYIPAEPAMFHPLVLLAARAGGLFGGSPGTVYYAVALLLHWACMAAWLWMLDVFCPTRGQRWAALAVTVCAVPPKLFAALAGNPLGAFGMLEYAHESADNFLRGGLGLAWCTGVLGVLCTMTLGALYLQGRRVFHWLALAVFLNALFHPFEVALTIPALGLAILLGLAPERRWSHIALLAAAGAAGVAPYVWATLRHDWVAQIARNNIWPAPWPGWVVMSFGLPAMAVVYLLMVRGRLTAPADRLLLLWFVLPVGLMYLPVIPFALHLYNGYAYMLGALAVRLWCTHKKLPRAVEGRAWPKFAAGATVAASLAALAALYVQLAADGRSPDPELLTSSVVKPERSAVLRWIASSTNPGDVVLSPPELAPWLPTILRRAPASHDIVSGPLFKQSAADLRRLYDPPGAAPDQIRDILGRYNARYVVAPPDSGAGRWLAANASLQFRSGATAVYKLAP